MVFRRCLSLYLLLAANKIHPYCSRSFLEREKKYFLAVLFVDLGRAKNFLTPTVLLFLPRSSLILNISSLTVYPSLYSPSSFSSLLYAFWKRQYTEQSRFPSRPRKKPSMQLSPYSLRLFRWTYTLSTFRTRKPIEKRSKIIVGKAFYTPYTRQSSRDAITICPFFSRLFGSIKTFLKQAFPRSTPRKVMSGSPTKNIYDPILPFEKFRMACPLMTPKFSLKVWTHRPSKM